MLVAMEFEVLQLVLHMDSEYMCDMRGHAHIQLRSHSPFSSVDFLASLPILYAVFRLLIAPPYS